MEHRNGRDRRLQEAAEYASDVGVLGALRALTRLRGILLLPIIARALGPSAYGAWTQSLVAVSFGSLLIGLQLQSAVVRFVAGTDKRAEQRAIFFPSLLVTAGLGAVVAVVAAKSSKMIATLILGDARYEGIGALLGLWIGLSACSQLGLNLIRGLHRVKLQGILSTGHILVQLIAVSAAILLTDQLLLGVRAAIAVELLFLVLVLTLCFGWIGFGWPGWGHLRAIFRFSLPLVPTYYAGSAISFADRLLIAAQLGSEAVGVYAAAHSVARIIRELFVPIRTALMPAASRSWDRGDRQQTRWLLKNTTRFYLLLAVPALVGLALLGPGVLAYLATASIAEGVRLLIPFLALAFLLTSLQSVYSIALQLARDTLSLAIARLIAATLYIILLFVAVSRWGSLGGAMAAALGYGVDMALTIVMARRRLRFPFPARTAAKAVLASGVMVPAVLVVLGGNWVSMLAAALVGLVAYTALLVALGALGRREWQFFRSTLSTADAEWNGRD